MNTIEELVAELNPVPQVEPVTRDDVARVVEMATRVAAQDESVAAPTRRRTRIRLGWVIATAAAAVTVPVVVAVLPDGAVAPAAAEPATILRQGAAATTPESDPVPRADQFVYSKTGTQQVWMSVDGTHDGLVRNGMEATLPGCRNGVQLVAGNYPGLREQPCTPTPAYLSDAPSDIASMQAWLVARATSSNTKNPGSDPTATNAVAKTTVEVLTQYWVSAGARRALFEVIATYPGLSVVTDGLPTGDVGVSWSYGGGTTILVFDPRTHAFVGTASTADSSVSLTTTTIVDHVGDVS